MVVALFIHRAAAVLADMRATAALVGILAQHQPLVLAAAAAAVAVSTATLQLALLAVVAA
jgi:hypothetical protein